MTRQIALSAHGLSKRFTLHTERRFTLKERLVRGRPRGHKDFWALRDVDFEVEKGSFFGIIGHNGSGKSTALKVLAGIYRPTSGQVRVNGRVRALLELGAGFNPELTGRENIQLNASILGLTQREIRLATDQIIEFAGVGDFIDAPVKVYSSGMSVRLGFAVAVTMDPEILIVDEIIAVGDEEFQRRCYDYMFDLRRQGRTVVLVTHSLAMIETMCDSALWLDQGRVKGTGEGTAVVMDYVRQVNEREARQDSAADQPEPLREDYQVGANRRGSGEVVLTDIEMLDGAGQAMGSTTTGASARFRLHYEAVADLHEVNVGLGFYTSADLCLSFVNNRDTTVVTTLPAGRGFIDFHVERLPLLPGEYFLATAFARQGHYYDLFLRAASLKVRTEGRQRIGLVEVAGKWGELTQEPGKGEADAARRVDAGGQPHSDS